MPRFLTVAMAILIGATLASPAAAQRRFIELEIQASSVGELGIQQDWMERLQDVGADRVLIKSGQRTDIPAIEEIPTGAGDSVTIRIYGAISNRQLYLPGGRYSLQQVSAIKDYIQKLRDDGARVALAEKKAFGMTSEQLVELHEDLEREVAFATRGMTVAELVSKIGGAIKTPLRFSEQARRAGQAGTEVTVEMQGFSCGTALAYAIRSDGLILVPQRIQGRPVELIVAQSGEFSEHWPVGWAIDEPPVKVSPPLFERIDFEIRQFSLADALQAIERRSGVPMWFDHNSLAEKELDLKTIKVNYVRKQTDFMIATRALLSQTRPRMDVELRTDERGKAFLWIY